jgi:DNA-binding CsgD family transcriptional regulator
MDQCTQSRSTRSELSEKQKAVLDLVIRHKSSKEIARTLGISPYTVDQRITSARQKLGLNTRSELARAYIELKRVCEETAYDFPHIAPDHDLDDEQPQAPAGPVYTLSDVAQFNLAPPWQDKPISLAGLEALDRRLGIHGRILAIVGTAAAMALLLLAVAAIAEMLTKIV